MLPSSGADRRQWLPLSLLAFVVFIWASNTIVSKLALQEATPTLLALVRFSLAAIGFHLPVFLLIRRVGPPLRRDEWRRLATAGILGPGSSTLFFTIGVATTPATYAGLILMTAPIWTALLARVFLGERLGGVRAVGMAMAFVGAGVLATDGELEGVDAGVLVGTGFLLLAQICWGGYTLLSKPLLSRRQPLLVLAASHLLALAALWPMTLLLGAWAELPRVLTWSTSTWLATLYMVLFVTGLSQALYVYGLREVSASRAISFMYLQPIFTALLAAWVLNERPTVLTFACGALILLGLWLVNRPQPPAPRELRLPTSEPVGGRP
jgi:drug/metabolite transporter (DMT)-like permease